MPAKRTKTLTEVRESIAYSVIYAPDEYPAEDQANWASEYRDMHETLTSLVARCRDQDKERWLQLALWDLEKADQAFAKGEDRRGCFLLQDCEGYLSNAASGKQHKIDFIVGSDGTTHGE